LFPDDCVGPGNGFVAAASLWRAKNRPSKLVYGQSSPAIQGGEPAKRGARDGLSPFSGRSFRMTFPERGSRAILAGNQACIESFTALGSDAICALGPGLP